MKISLTEIWNFIDLITTGERGWEFNLHAGEVSISGLTPKLLVQLKNDQHYDTEILPSIFTFREILWQPDVFTEAKASLPGLRILDAHSIEIAEQLRSGGAEASELYANLIEGVGSCCQKALVELEKNPSNVTKVLGDFRIAAFPIIKFFIFHPMNRNDYFHDAVNRLNYAVKIMLTQFHGRYTELADPFWEVHFIQQTKSAKTKQTVDQNVLNQIDGS